MKRHSNIALLVFTQMIVVILFNTKIIKVKPV